MKKLICIFAMMMVASQAFAVDVTLKNVPERAVKRVKEMAAIAVEREYRKSVSTDRALQDKFELDVDLFREANGMEKKFDVAS